MLGLASASFLAFGALLVLFGSNASQIIEDLSLDYARYGFVASVLSMGLGVGILAAGPLVDRLPRRPLYAGSCLVVALGCLVVGPGTNYTELLVASFAIGLGAGFYETVLNAVTVEQHGRSAPRRLLWIHSAATLGAALTPLLVGLLRAPLDLHWSDVFGIVGGLHLLLVAGTTWIPNRPHAAAHGSVPRPRASERERRAIFAICTATFAYVGVESALTFFVADFAHRDLGLPSERATGVVGLFWAGLLFGRLATGLLPREPRAKDVGIFAAGASVVMLAFGAGLLSVPELAVGLTGLLLGGAFPVLIGLAGLALSSAPGFAVALAAGCGSLGGFAVPWLTGWLASGWTLGTAMASLGVWLTLLATACGVTHRLTRPGTSRSDAAEAIV